MSKLTTEYGLLASAMDPKLSTEYAAPAAPTWSNVSYGILGTDGYIQQTGLNTSILSDFSISVWMKKSNFTSTSNTAALGLVHLGNTTVGTYSAYVGFNAYFRNTNGTSSNYVVYGAGNQAVISYFDSSVYDFDDDNWHHFCFVWDYSASGHSSGAINASHFANGLTVYFDNNVMTMGPNFIEGSGGSTGIAMNQVRFGDTISGAGSQSFNTDNCAYWGGTALSPNEVDLIYNGGMTGIDLQNTTNLTAPSTWFRFEDANDLIKETVSNSNTNINSSGLTQGTH